MIAVSEIGRYRKAILGVYGIVVMILLLAPVTDESMADVVIWFDKWIHFGLFGGMAFLGYWVVHAPVRVTMFATAVAALAELLQGPLSFRSADVWDLVAGAVGAAAGVLVARVAAQQYHKRIDAKND